MQPEDNNRDTTELYHPPKHKVQETLREITGVQWKVVNAHALQTNSPLINPEEAATKLRNILHLRSPEEAARLIQAKDDRVTIYMGAFSEGGLRTLQNMDLTSEFQVRNASPRARG